MRNCIWIILVGLLLGSCTSDVPGNLGLDDYERKVVVNAGLTPDSLPEIQLVWSNGILEVERYQTIDDAIFELTSESGSIEFTHTTNGKYVGNQNVVHGETYSLEANIGERQISASDLIPLPIEIQTISFQDSTFISSESGTSGLLHLSFDDLPNSSNFYEIQVYQKNEGSMWICDIWTSNLSVVNSSGTDIFQDAKDQISSALIEDDLFDGKTFNFEARVWTNFPDRPIYVRLKSVSPLYFDYLKAFAHTESVGDSPFSEPITIPSNVSGGLGIFVGYSLSEKIVID